MLGVVWARVSTYQKDVSVPLTVAVLGLLATLAGTAIAFGLARWGEANATRRDNYADAVRDLVALIEYPYRVRRRPSDDPEVLGRLADRGHDLQERLSYRQAWIRSENRWVGTVYDEVVADIRVSVARTTQDAWTLPPTRTAADMNVGDWGASDVREALGRLEQAALFRFGWRRVPSLFGWHPGA